MKVDIYALESMGDWGIIDIYESMNAIDSIWYFKCKPYPYGLINKFKPRFCERGDQQLEVIDLFETYASVMQWTTVKSMFILEVLLGLKSNQGNVTAEFTHVDIPDNDKVYIEMPRVFEQFSQN